MQGNLIGKAETESLFHEIRTKFIAPYNRPHCSHKITPP